MSDPLLAGLADGRDDAFAAVYDQYGPALYRVAGTLLRSRPDAEDAVQEVFLGLVRSRTSLGRVENLRAYLFGALRHAVARLAARKDPGPPPPVSDDIRIDPEMADWLERALAELPAEQREVLTLKIDGGLTFAEVAAVVGISANTAASRYRYALEKLRGLFGEEYHATRPASGKPA